jgi:hypothetical protein
LQSISASIEAISRKTLQDVNDDSEQKQALRLFPLEFWLHLWGNAKGVHENLAVRRIYYCLLCSICSIVFFLFDSIQTLREKGFSYREIADWVSQRGVDVDHNAVYRVYRNSLSDYDAHLEDLQEAEEAQEEAQRNL